MKKAKHTLSSVQSLLDAAGAGLQILDLTYERGAWYCSVLCPLHGYSVSGLRPLLREGSIGCKKCNMVNKTSALTKPISEIQASLVSDYGDKYAVLAVEDGQVRLSCALHGEFSVSRKAFGARQGILCKACRALVQPPSVRRVSEPEWFRRAIAKHGDRYSYHGITYIAGAAWFDIECKTHGRFEVRAKAHTLHGHGCRTCWYEGGGRAISAKADEHFIAEAVKTRAVTNGEVTVVGVEGRSNTRKIQLSCKAHGLFTTKLADLKKGVGCARCACGSFGSSLTGRVTQLLDTLQVTYKVEVPLAGDRQRWDIVIESKKLAIELDGLYWHSDNVKSDHLFMVKKAKCAEAAGYSQINLFEDEIINKTAVVEKLLAYRLGVSTPKVFARKLSVHSLASPEAREFLSRTHIQGFASGNSYLGLKDQAGKLLACLVTSFRVTGRSGKKSSESAVIERYAADGVIVGGFGKLLSAVQQTMPTLTEITTYSDPRLFSGGLYEKLGFKVSAIRTADYCYIKSGVRIAKRLRQKSWFKENADYAEGLTERELAQLNGHFRLWDRGRVTWKLDLKRISASQHQVDSAPRAST